MSNRRLQRRTFWVVAYAAFALALLRPVCDVQAAVHSGQQSDGLLQLVTPAQAGAHLPAQHDDGDEPCCASMSEAMPGDGYEMAALTQPPAGNFVDFHADGISRRPANRATRSPAPSDTALPRPSFYARSARIQR